MRVLLANPPLPSRFSHPPIGLLYLASSLLHAGYEADVVDGAIVGEHGVLEKIARYKPHVVGIQIISMHRHVALRMAALIKAQDPRIKIVAGGPHCSVMPNHVRSYPFIDAVCVGDGEQWIIDYVQGRPQNVIDHIELRRNLNELKLPAWQLANFSAYKSKEVSICTSRGCTAKCSFCFNPNIWRQWRGRSADSVVTELIHLYGMGRRKFYFTDDHFVADRQRVIDICKSITSTSMKIRWFCSARADGVDPEMLRWMKKAGCYQIGYGIESVSPVILESIHKGDGPHVEIVERAIRETKEAGIETMAAMMTGNIGETDETVMESADFLKRSMPTICTHARGVWILPNTALYREAVKRGIIADDFWYGKQSIMYWPFTQRKLRRWALMMTAFRPWHFFRKRLADRLYIYFPRTHTRIRRIYDQLSSTPQ